MKWLFLIPAIVLAAAFTAGVVVGLAILFVMPVTRRRLARQAAELQLQARALEAWQTVVEAYRAAVQSAREEAH